MGGDAQEFTLPEIVDMLFKQDLFQNLLINVPSEHLKKLFELAFRSQLRDSLQKFLVDDGLETKYRKKVDSFSSIPFVCVNVDRLLSFQKQTSRKP